jgi:hypothetical protein
LAGWRPGEFCGYAGEHWYSPLIGGPVGTSIALSFFCLTGIWQSAGIWRSAGNSLNRKRGYLWPVLARAVAVIWVCLTVFSALFHPDWVLK